MSSELTDWRPCSSEQSDTLVLNHRHKVTIGLKSAIILFSQSHSIEVGRQGKVSLDFGSTTEASDASEEAVEIIEELFSDYTEDAG